MVKQGLATNRRRATLTAHHITLQEDILAADMINCFAWRLTTPHQLIAMACAVTGKQSLANGSQFQVPSRAPLSLLPLQ